MLKKIVMGAALCASASFAGWDLFPVLENHKGEFMVGEEFMIQGLDKAHSPMVGVRYTVMPNLELGLAEQYVWVIDGCCIGEYMGNPIFMVRYQFTPNINAFLDMSFPMGDSEYFGDGFGIAVGAQYSQKFGFVDFGSQLGFSMTTEGKDGMAPPFGLSMMAEADFETGSFVKPYLNAGLQILLGEYTVDGNNVSKLLLGESVSGKMLVNTELGAEFSVTQTVRIKVSASVDFGDEVIVGSDTPITFGLTLSKGF